uniref:Uncharacterized protein n=1 Tax=Anguilla anguilla TaxID=7936 RepID=A0A0E9SCP1_ANGAN
MNNVNIRNPQNSRIRLSHNQNFIIRLSHSHIREFSLLHVQNSRIA